MSYDYLLVRGEPDAEMAAMLEGLGGEEAALVSIWAAAMSNAIGSIEEVKASISSIFSNLKWKKSSAPVLRGLARESPIADWSWAAVGGPELTSGR
jgi:hypothetical protein